MKQLKSTVINTNMAMQCQKTQAVELKDQEIEQEQEQSGQQNRVHLRAEVEELVNLLTDDRYKRQVYEMVSFEYKLN